MSRGRGVEGVAEGEKKGRGGSVVEGLVKDVVIGVEGSVVVDLVADVGVDLVFVRVASTNGPSFTVLFVWL